MSNETKKPLDKVKPGEFVEAVLSEIEQLCKAVRTEETGSTLQRGLFTELEDCVDVLLNPDCLPSMRKTTCNGFLYEKLGDINWEE